MVRTKLTSAIGEFIRFSLGYWSEQKLMAYCLGAVGIPLSEETDFVLQQQLTDSPGEILEEMGLGELDRPNCSRMAFDQCEGDFPTAGGSPFRKDLPGPQSLPEPSLDRNHD
jgi:hypothetical protein